jgi:hypothetical protein
MKKEISKKDLKPSLLAAGNLALAARMVTTATAKNLSQRIEKMEVALDIYDNEIMNLSNVTAPVCDMCEDGSGWYGYIGDDPFDSIIYNCSKCNPNAL